MEEFIESWLNKFGIKPKPRKNKKGDSEPLERYRSIPLHAIILYTSEDTIVSEYIINNWGALDSLSGKFCDIHQTIDQFESKEDAYDFIEGLDVIKNSNEILVSQLPGMFFWNMDAESSFVSFKEIQTTKELTELIRALFEKIRIKPTIKSVENFKHKKGRNRGTPSSEGKIKVKWWMISIICGILSVVLFKILEKNPDWIFEAIIGISISVIVLMLNPIRRFYKAFWSALTLIGTLTLIPAFNLKSYVNESSLKGGEKRIFELIVEDQHWLIYVILGCIAIASLFLDYYERREKSS